MRTKLALIALKLAVFLDAKSVTQFVFTAQRDMYAAGYRVTLPDGGSSNDL